MFKIDFRDNVSKKLFDLSKASNDVVNSAIQQAGVKLRKEMIAYSKTLDRLSTSQTFTEDGFRRLTGTKENASKKAYARYSKRGYSKDKYASMAEFIRVAPDNLRNEVFIGYRETKGFTYTKFKQGIAYGKGKVHRLSKESVKIAEKMANGGTYELSRSQKNLFRASGWGKIAKRGYVTYKARPIVEPVVNRLRATIESDVFKNVARDMQRKFKNAS